MFVDIHQQHSVTLEVKEGMSTLKWRRLTWEGPVYAYLMMSQIHIIHSSVLTTNLCFQVALVYGQMNEPPGARARVALTGLTVAEYFRDQEGQDVLLFIDNIFRFTQAGSEVYNVWDFQLLDEIS